VGLAADDPPNENVEAAAGGLGADDPAAPSETVVFWSGWLLTAEVLPDPGPPNMFPTEPKPDADDAVPEPLFSPNTDVGADGALFDCAKGVP
jgi:hypothetical protein